MKHFLLALLFTIIPSLVFAQNHVSYTYDSAGNRDSRTWTTGSVMARHGSDSLFPVQIPITPDTLNIKSVRTKVSLDPNNLPLVLSEDEKSWLNDEFFKSQMAEEEAWWKEYEKRPKLRATNTTYSVGAIPLQEGVSPTGARTYNLPIPTAAGFKLVPNISLAYNSQASEGWAGYGWDIQGISCIKLINKNEYYHGEIKAADVTASDPVFALDGVPLVTNEHSATSSEYPLETARGHILAATETNSYGRVTKFTVLYPNGVRAVYGRSHSYNYNLVFYKLSEMQDLDGNKITFTYTVDPDAGNDCLTAIRYGYDSSNNYSGEITFTYTNWTDSPIRYFAGKPTQYNKCLTSVKSRSDGEILSFYNLTFIQRDNVRLLIKVDCSSGSFSLPPIEFTYGSLPAESYIRQDVSSGINLNPYEYLPFSSHIYRRGKFLSGEYRDGILIFPSTSTGGDNVLLIPRLEGSSTVNTTLSTDQYTKTFETADIDSDGVDEIVRIGTRAEDYNLSAILIDVYKCNDSGEPVSLFVHSVNVPGACGTDPVIPYTRDYRMGDFDGDGKMELFMIAYSKSSPGDQGYSQTCYATLIDIMTGNVLCNQTLFQYSYDKLDCLIVNDIDSDGRSEVCYASDSGFSIYRYRPSPGLFVLEKTLPIPTASSMISPDLHCQVTDLNGDGYLDILRPFSGQSTWSVYYYTGDSFSEEAVSIVEYSPTEQLLFLDVNRDGLADAVKVSDTQISTAINLNGRSFGQIEISPSTVSNAYGIIPVYSSAFNKTSSFIKIDSTTVYNYSYNAISPVIRKVNTLKDSYGKIYRSSYAYLPSNAVTWSDTSITTDIAQGYAFQTLPIYVLSSEYSYVSDSPSSFYKVNQYEYYNGVVHKRGLGFCGFSRIRTREMVNVAQQNLVRDVADVYYSPEKMGVVKKVERRESASSTSTAYYTLTNTWDSHSTTYGKLGPRLTQSVSNDALTGVNARTYYTYDQWDYTTEVRVERLLSGAATQRERQKFTYLHCNTPTKYVLGIVTNESHWQDLDGQATRQWKNKVLTTYDSVFHPLTRKSYVGISRSPAANPYYEAVDSTALVSETRWTYDSHGNVLTEKSAPYNATEFTGHTYTYDANGRYLLTDTDALGHTTVYANYNKFGKPSRMDDYRSRSTSYTYDSWGRVTSVTHIDGTMENTSYAWGGTGTYTVTSSINGGPQSVTHYDALDREVRSGTKRFDGQWQYTDTKYNRYGRVSQSSLPFRGATPTYWNTYTYDTHDRPKKITEASGKQTTWSYSGTSVTTVKDGIISVSTKDASGNVVSVQDAGGTITYTLRDDGQPSKITAPGNVETTFAYDNYGRRTSIIDPSAGTRTEAYVWNADGSHQQTHTGSNGSITTIWDKYGRTTSVQRPGEFNTTYTYNAYGLLTNEQSTNGTGTEYTYDNYDRIATVKETVPDGKWLKKTYTYGSWGNVSTIKYATQGGDITTETYSYANGNNTGVSIAGGTTVWSLVEENDLGMPTEITTGLVTREYGFTDFGMPTYRKMGGGNLQSFTYNFNINTGNLTSRTDVVNNKTESFVCDSLNRLRAMNGRIIGLDNNGNITSMGGVGTIDYGITDKPYQVTSLTPSSTSLVPDRQQEISYNSLDRPSVLEEGDKTATFTYNAVGDRVEMQVTDGITNELTRYYIGGQYEYDSTPAGIKERLYLGGDAYSAPMVLQRTNSGSWTAYNIGRDYLGSITHIATSSGTKVAEYSYDPWGRLRNPATQAIYTPGTEPALFLGRGYTGHEHLTWFGLINMNARLYDPLLGRFLSPDPYVQAPDFTQNFNRYSYALNNPLRYRDVTGEFFILDSFIVGLFIGGWDKAKQMAENDLKIWGGLFTSDKNKGFLGGAFDIISRFTWQLPQTFIGFLSAHSLNTFQIKGGVDSVDYLHGATVLKSYVDKTEWGGITFGSYIIGNNDIEASDDNRWFQHEFGHYLQSQEHGFLWLFDYAIPSGISALVNDNDGHDAFYTEQDANARSFKYLSKYFGQEYAKKNWIFKKNPIIGYDKSKSDLHNMSVIEGKIIHLNISLKKKDGVEEEVEINSDQQNNTYTIIF